MNPTKEAECENCEMEGKHCFSMWHGPAHMPFLCHLATSAWNECQLPACQPLRRFFLTDCRQLLVMIQPIAHKLFLLILFFNWKEGMHGMTGQPCDSVLTYVPVGHGWASWLLLKCSYVLNTLVSLSYSHINTSELQKLLQKQKEPATTSESVIK